MAESAVKKEEVAPFSEPTAFTMPSNYPLRTFRIKYDGMFDWTGLYKLIYEWFIDRGYYFEEKVAAHKIPTPMGAEDEYEFEGWKRTTSYMKEVIKMHLHFFEMRDVEVIKDGQKKKMVKARVIMTFSGGIETGYAGRWSQTQLGQQLRGLLENYVIKKELESIWWDRLYYVMIKLHTEIKNYLNMQAKENAYYDVW